MILLDIARIVLVECVLMRRCVAVCRVIGRCRLEIHRRDISITSFDETMHVHTATPPSSHARDIVTIRHCGHARTIGVGITVVTVVYGELEPLSDDCVAGVV